MNEHTDNPSEEALPPELQEAMPADSEEYGPIPELLAAAAAEVQIEALPGSSDAAESVLAAMGVESESVEAGQILGLVLATIIAILALATVLIFLFYMPARTGFMAAAEGEVQYPELVQTRVDGQAKLSQNTRSDSVYTQTIESAMASVVRAYGGKTDAVYNAKFGMPVSRQRYNEMSVNRGMGSAIQGGAASIALSDTTVAAPQMEQSAPDSGAPTVPATTPLEPAEVPS